MRLYLDHNATTPAAAEVVAAQLPWLRERFGNPASAHAPGEQAADALEAARRQVARLIGARSPSEVLFTSGGSESIASALHAALAARSGRDGVVTSAAEHSATLEPLAAREARGLRVVRVGVDAQGRLDGRRLLASIDARCALVTLLLANNETGVVADLGGVAARCREAGALLHLDAVQAAGKLALDTAALGCDLLSLSAHKLHGPKGAGALWVRQGTPFEPLLPGSQEGGRRAGTPDVAALVGFGVAAELARAHVESGGPALVALLRERLEVELERRLGGVIVHGRGAPRLCNTANLCFEGVDGDALLALLAAQDLQASAGSACHARARAPSHVLLAMGCPEGEARSSLRLSLSRQTTAQEVERALGILCEAVSTLRALEARPL